uniref:Reverse transcriptase zinc-binding domain-containing protein n=1 Tax=Cajanus cajan TaxID=3821 RepID=A0A151RS50_CAJCA|nr:hypothetical protein KK1_033088 [Cajanus cajan]KYP45387.1 hypothetical protein KK1_033095 [Cajanus cajan]
MQHILFKCGGADWVWKVFGLIKVIRWNDNVSWLDWMLRCFKKFHILPVIICWQLWKDRNTHVFNGLVGRPSSQIR